MTARGDVESLLPCPHCGAPAELHECDWSEPPTWSVYCVGTTCSFTHGNAEAAIAAWNRRPAPAPAEPPDKVERVAAAIYAEFWGTAVPAPPGIDVVRFHWVEAGPDARERFLAMARAALAALPAEPQGRT
jgi:hypothetical protein